MASVVLVRSQSALVNDPSPYIPPLSPSPSSTTADENGPTVTTSEAAPANASFEDIDDSSLRLLFGQANEFKEGDATISVASASNSQRSDARQRLLRLRLHQIISSRFLNDEVSAFLESSIDIEIAKKLATWTLGDLKNFLLTADEVEIKRIMPGLGSEVIAGVAKLMSNEELIQVSSKIYNEVPGSTLGRKGYFGSRIQPNSATDDPEEVLMSVLEGLSYGCGDAIFGINIVASDHPNVTALQRVLRDVIDTFQINNSTHYSVLAHIDDQMAVENTNPGLTDAAFQSIGGTEGVNRVFNINIDKLKYHLQKVKAQYFETGQGSAVTNNVSGGVDMVTCEARAHGIARALKNINGNWTIVNTVAGFIGPEVFRSTDQLLRACLEDLFMGKLHGLVFGLDVCSTYHMGVNLDEIGHIQDEVMRAGPAFYMAVAGRNDPMLSYLTTGFRDHPRLRLKHNKRVTDEMTKFFQAINIMDENGNLTSHAGDTAYVYALYKQRKGDTRSLETLQDEARTILKKLQGRGLDLGYGHDGNFNPPREVQERLEKIYNDAKKVIYENLASEFIESFSNRLVLHTEAVDREQYLIHPSSGESISRDSMVKLEDYQRELQRLMDSLPDDTPVAQIVISDGLNARSIETSGHLQPLLHRLKELLSASGIKVAERPIIAVNGRVRAGYTIGKKLFHPNHTIVSSPVAEKKSKTAWLRNKIGTIRRFNRKVDTSNGSRKSKRKCIVLHAVGERPGNGNNTYSVYISCVSADSWNLVDHNVVDVVCGISNTALKPELAAEQVVKFIDNRLKVDDEKAILKEKKPGELRII